ncbi:leucine-rich repeat domain-containing protein [Ruminococcus sp.]|uniref:leucine-rich repeat domain-containing protein n=1 Tax=Ruminococcus sp. TaxID=41978 RepID=UPI0025E83F85|nr:leucine-rich repeat domain-containing protein [Ruminococcus sp.]
MLEHKKIAAFIAGLLICAFATAPLTSSFAEEEKDDSSVLVDLQEDDNEETDDAYVKSGDFMYSKTHDDTVCIEDYTGTSSVLEVPDKIDGIAVTELGKTAFGSDPDNNPITEIQLPASITYISDSNPFMYCTKLEKISVAEDNKDYCTEDSILYTKSKDTLICYPCRKGGTFFTVPDSVKTLGTSALYDTGLEDIKLPDGLEKIGYFSIACLPRMTSIDLSNTKVTEILPYAFSSCSTLSDVKFPEGLTYIGGGAFSSCPILKDIKLPDSLVEIGQYAFINTGLSAVIIPDNVAEIGYCAFGYSTNTVGNIVADDSFTLVGKLGSAAQRYATDSDTEYDYKNNFVFLTLEEYQQELDYLNIERVKSGDFEYGVTEDGAVLTCCYSEEEGVLTIPAEIDGNKIIKIYPSCFSITQASEIILPDGIEELREMAFYNCKNLKKITLPSSVKLIGDRAFDGCSALENIEFLGAEKIGNRVFCDCSSLKTFKSASTLKEWNDEEPFIFCTALENIDISSGSVFITENGIMYNNDKTILMAYPANKADKSFSVPASVNEIAQSAFSNCHYIESVKLPNVKVINAYAFENCESLSSFDVSDKLEKMGNDALYNCVALKSLRLPSSLHEIGDYAFGYYYKEDSDTENGESEDILVNGFTLYTEEGSEAYKYAQREGIKVVTGTTKVFGKNMSSGFVYTMIGIIGAALLGIIGVLTGKAVKKNKAKKDSAQRKAKAAELRKKKAEETADEEEDENIEEDD